MRFLPFYLHVDPRPVRKYFIVFWVNSRQDCPLKKSITQKDIMFMFKRDLVISTQTIIVVGLAATVGYPQHKSQLRHTILQATVFIWTAHTLLT